MKKKSVIIAEILLALMLAVIWGNSLLSGESSGELSGGVAAFISRLFGIDSENLGHIVRKCAHFSEFALLGVIAVVLLLWKEKRGQLFYMPLALGMLAFPLIDETIQLFTPGRGPMVTDIWIDMAGYVTGAAVALLVHKLIMRRRRKKKAVAAKA